MVVFYVIHHRGSEKITIHALRGEGDFPAAVMSVGKFYFYPRPPWGGRLWVRFTCVPRQNFYPRPPWGGRLADAYGLLGVVGISIHALRGEGDQERR